MSGLGITKRCIGFFLCALLLTSSSYLLFQPAEVKAATSSESKKAKKKANKQAKSLDVSLLKDKILLDLADRVEKEIMARGLRDGASQSRAKSEPSQNSSSDSSFEDFIDSLVGKEKVSLEGRTYMDCTISQMHSTFDSNYLKAQQIYEGAYIRFTGCVNYVGGSTLSLKDPSDDSWLPYTLSCFYRDKQQEALAADLVVGQQITLEGECTRVGSIMGYYIDIDHIYP